MGAERLAPRGAFGIFGPHTEVTATNANVTGATVLDISAANVFDLTLTGNATLSFVNTPPSGQKLEVVLILRQNGVGGYTTTFPVSWTWDHGVTPLFPTSANSVAIIRAVTTDGGISYQAWFDWTSVAAGPSSVIFNYTGALQTVTVPAGRTSLTFDLRGASGGSIGSNAGLGGRVQGTIAVTPGSVLQINVGGTGINTTVAGVNVAGGWNGGGAGGSSGGGATDLRTSPNGLVDRFAVAGGGGGAGLSTGNGGGGGGGYYGGGGGGFSASATESIATAGVSGIGGAGGDSTATGQAAAGASAGGAGGGTVGTAGVNGGSGITGGGAGTASAGGAAGVSGNLNPPAGGGGGSGFASASATGIVHTSGVTSGNGIAVLTWG